MEMAESTISSPSDVESPNDSASSDLDEYQTPQKKRYKNSIADGFSKRRARYHRISPEKRLPKTSTKSIRNRRTGHGASQPTHETEMDITTDEEGIGNITPGAIPENEDSISDESESLHLAIHSPSSSHSLLVSPMSNSDAFTTSISTSYSSSSNTDVENSEPDSHSSDDISDGESFSDESLSTENELDEDLAKPLYDGCRLSKFAVYSMIMLYVTKQSLSKDGFEELLQIISALLPESANFATSVYKVKELLKKKLDFNDPIVHFYCESCQKSLKENEVCQNNVCQRNQAPALEFYDLNMKEQLKKLCGEENFIKLVQKQKEKTKEPGLTDIVQGSRYKETMAQAN